MTTELDERRILTGRETLRKAQAADDLLSALRFALPLLGGMNLPAAVPQATGRTVGGRCEIKLHGWPIYLPARYTPSGLEVAFGLGWVPCAWNPAAGQYEREA